jgi:hypothetical protein
MTRLSRAELPDMRSVLERSLQRAERRRHARAVTQDAEATALAAAVADLNDELAGMP